jgi:hypothetical protein
VLTPTSACLAFNRDHLAAASSLLHLQPIADLDLLGPGRTTSMPCRGWREGARREESSRHRSRERRIWPPDPRPKGKATTGSEGDKSTGEEVEPPRRREMGGRRCSRDRPQIQPQPLPGAPDSAA